MTQADQLRVELQAELPGRRDAVFPLVSTAQGMASWLDAASMDERLGGAVRFRLLDAVAVGKVVSLQPFQHVSYTWDWEGQPLGHLTVVAFDLIDHGPRVHLTLRHVGFRGVAQARLHEAMWRYWFGRLVEATAAI